MKDKTGVDKLPPIYSDLITSEDSFALREQMNAINVFMHKLFPAIKSRIFDDRIALHDFFDEGHLEAYVEIVLVGDTIYMNRALRNADALLEGFLHPFVEILADEKRDFFVAMLEEAKNSFSRLERQIEDSFHEGKETKEKELVARALSRYFREDLGQAKDRHHGSRCFLDSFVRLDKDVFGIETYPDFRKSEYWTWIVPIDSLTNLYSLADLAAALNTKGVSFDVSGRLKDEAVYCFGGD